MKDLQFDMKQIIQDAEKKRQQEIENLESSSRSLYTLVATEEFTVDEVVAESYATSFTPHSEMRVGGSSPVYNGGFTSRLILKVSPNNQDLPVRTIYFNGFSIVRAGDYVSAKIPRYEEKKIGDGEFDYNPYRRSRVFYFDRGFNAEESAIELALLSRNGKVLRKDRAVDYKNFVKE